MNVSFDMDVYVKEIDENLTMEFNVDVSHGRKGNSVDHYDGPTPDEPAEIEICEILLDGADVTDVYAEGVDEADMWEKVNEVLDPFA